MKITLTKLIGTHVTKVFAKCEHTSFDDMTTEIFHFALSFVGADANGIPTICLENAFDEKIYLAAFNQKPINFDMQFSSFNEFIFFCLSYILPNPTKSNKIKIQFYDKSPNPKPFSNPASNKNYNILNLGI